MYNHLSRLTRSEVELMSDCLLTLYIEIHKVKQKVKRTKINKDLGFYHFKKMIFKDLYKPIIDLQEF